MNKLKKRTIMSILSGVAIVILEVSSCSDGRPGGAETISIGEISDVVMAPVDIAGAEGFFTKSGLSASIKRMVSGTTINQALIKGDIDFAAMTEYAIVGDAFNGEPVQIIASVNKFESVFILARNDHGIGTIDDLRGKRIAVTRNAIPEFYLGRFLYLNGLSVEDVSLIDASPPQAGELLASGQVDAAVMRQPFAGRFRIALADKITVWPAQSSQFAHIVIACRHDWLDEHKEIAQRFLSAVAQANEYITNHPDEAKATVSDELGIDPAYVEETWSASQFSLTLDFSLIVTMNDEARWMIEHDLTARTHAPNFLDYIYEDDLMTVNPKIVHISR